jgi:hypothetical protein
MQDHESTGLECTFREIASPLGARRILWAAILAPIVVNEYRCIPRLDDNIEVVVVVAGDGEVPHPAVAFATRSVHRRNHIARLQSRDRRRLPVRQQHQCARRERLAARRVTGIVAAVGANSPDIPAGSDDGPYFLAKVSAKPLSG